MFGIVSAASVRRLPTCVRSGPTRPRRGGAADRVAVRAPGCVMKTRSPERGLRRGRRCGAGAAWRRSQARNAAGGCDEHVERHLGVLERRRTPSTGRGRRRRRSASSSIRFARPGIMSILRLRRGTQKLWMTSAVVARRRPRGVPAGMWISFAVTAAVPG